MKTLCFISRNWRKKSKTVAFGFSPITIHYSEYPKRFINRINEVYVCSIKYHYSDILLKHINFICSNVYKRLFRCNHLLFCWQRHVIKVDPRRCPSNESPTTESVAETVPIEPRC